LPIEQGEQYALTVLSLPERACLGKLFFRRIRAKPRLSVKNFSSLGRLTPMPCLNACGGQKGYKMDPSLRSE
jgi:hypothetical protein